MWDVSFGVLFILLIWVLRSQQYSISGHNYLINTRKCKIPNIPTYSPDLNLTRSPKVECTNFQPLLTYTTTENNQPKLHINHQAVAKYFGTPYNLKCCYSYIYRNGAQEYPDVGVMVSRCKEFFHSHVLNHDLVWVSCSRVPELNYGDIVYQNIHQVVTVPSAIEEKAENLKKSTTKRPISVLMIVIDSISRLNFYRTMPLTRNFVTSNGFYEFKGYNKVADNTFPNAMAFLSGLTLQEANSICRPLEIDGLMNCPLLWYKYRDSGYATAYAEDWAPIGTFNYMKKGFRDKPTDYYYKPYMDAITYLKSLNQDTMPFCAGPETQGDRILNLAKSFATTLKDIPYFGLFWMNTFSHNYITSPMSMDLNVRNFFRSLKNSSVLNESVVILLSDHGIRYGDILNTTRGFYELRLPMHYISLPQWFKREFPIEVRNFEENTEKLTSNFDLYMTLQHLLKMSIANYTISPVTACPHCRSFFEKIPKERSCLEAGIPDMWCTCNVDFTELNYDKGNGSYMIK